MEESGASGEEESVGTVGEMDEKVATGEGILDASGTESCRGVGKEVSEEDGEIS